MIWKLFIKSSNTDDINNRFIKSKLYKFHGGLKLEYGKEFTNTKPIKNFPIVNYYFLPARQHNGTIGRIIVNKGQKVIKGQPLTIVYKNSDLPIHSPVSGTIVDIINYPYPDDKGTLETTFLIHTDKKQDVEFLYPKLNIDTSNPKDIFQRIVDSGIAGLGGAVFPSNRKISPKQKLKTLIVNAIECESYITCDDILIQEKIEDIFNGIFSLKKISDIDNIIIAIEDNKPKAIKSIKKYISIKNISNIYVKVIPTIYPSGSSKVLVEILSGKQLKDGQQPNELGFTIFNVATCYSIGRAVVNGEPLTKRLVTLTGEKFKQSGNYWINFGTPLKSIIDYFNIKYNNIIMGGPMMGIVINDINCSVVKASNCFIFANNKELLIQGKELDCIRCSNCQKVCPMSLQPQQILLYTKSNNLNELKKHSVMSCIECGLCDYVCPSQIPLVSYFKESKNIIYTELKKAKLSNEAKERFDNKNIRIENEKLAIRKRQEQSKIEAEKMRNRIKENTGLDPVAQTIARLKAKGVSINKEIIVEENFNKIPDNSSIIEQRKLRKEQLSKIKINDNSNNQVKTAVQLAIEKAKAKQEATQKSTKHSEEKNQNNTHIKIKTAAQLAIEKAKAKQAKKLAEENNLIK